jgi:hypothetical protein
MKNFVDLLMRAMPLNPVKIVVVDNDDDQRGPRPSGEEAGQPGARIFRHVGDAACEDRAENHDQRRAECVTYVAEPERLFGRNVFRQIARIVGHVGSKTERPRGCLSDDQHECAVHISVRAQRKSVCGEGALKRNKGCCRKNQPGKRRHIHTHLVDQFIADVADDQRQYPEENDGRVVVHVVDRLDRVAHHDTIRSGEENVRDHDDEQRQTRAEHAELRAALDHLRDAQVRPLCRVPRHEDRPDQVAQNQADDRPEHAQTCCHAQRADHKGRHLHVGAEPDRKEPAWLAIPFILWNELNASIFDIHRFLAGMKGASPGWETWRCAAPNDQSGDPFYVLVARVNCNPLHSMINAGFPYRFSHNVAVMYGRKECEQE